MEHLLKLLRRPHYGMQVGVVTHSALVVVVPQKYWAGKGSMLRPPD